MCADTTVKARNAMPHLPHDAHGHFRGYNPGMERNHIELQASDSESEAPQRGPSLTPNANIRFNLRLSEGFSGHVQSHLAPSTEDTVEGDSHQATHRIIPTTTSSIAAGLSLFLPLQMD